MIVIALVLMAAAAALSVGVLAYSTDPARVDVGFTTAESTIGGVYLAGLLAGMVFVFGLALLQASLRRRTRRRREQRARLKEREQTVQDLEREKQEAEAERERLREQLSTRSRPPE
jgi:membrane protein implicated in regulation of membrane protease activity